MTAHKAFFKILLINLILITNCSAQSLSTAGGEFLYHPKFTGLMFGRGFSISNKSTPKRNFLQKFDSTDERHEESTSRINAISDYQTLEKELKINVEASADYLSFDASGSVNIQKSFFLSKTQLAIGLFYTVTYGKTLMIGEQLTREADSLKRIKNWHQFISSYGEYYVSGITRGQIVSVFLKLSNVSSTEKEDIVASMSGGMDIGALNFNLKTSLQSVLKTGIENNSLTAEVYHLGSSNTYEKDADLTELLKANKSSDQIIEVIEKYLRNRLTDLNNSKNSAVLSYIYSPMSQFGLPEDLIATTSDIKQDKKMDLANSFRIVKEQKEALGDLRNDINFRKYFYPDDLSYATHLEQELSGVQNTLLKSYQNCSASSCTDESICCNFPSFLSESITLKNTKQDYLEYHSRIDQIIQQAFYKYRNSPISNIVLNTDNNKVWIGNGTVIPAKFSIDSVFSSTRYHSAVNKKIRFHVTATFLIGKIGYVSSNNNVPVPGGPMPNFALAATINKSTNNNQILDFGFLKGNYNFTQYIPGPPSSGSIFLQGFNDVFEYKFDYTSDEIDINSLSGISELDFIYVSYQNKPIIADHNRIAITKLNVYFDEVN